MNPQTTSSPYPKDPAFQGKEFPIFQLLRTALPPSICIILSASSARPTYRTVTKSPVLPANELQNQPDAVNVQKNLMRMPSEKDKPLSAVLVR